MTTQRLGVIMNGVTGRMGLNQHLIRSIIAIRDQGGVVLSNGDRMMPDPILVGRDADKVERLAKQFNVARWTIDLDEALTNPEDTIFFDAATTQARPSLLTKAINAGKHVYCEKPIATNLKEAIDVLKLANEKGVKHGTVQDKLFLPGLKKLAFLRDSGFFGRMLSVRGEFGYWVFEGDWQQAQRPSWNYRRARWRRHHPRYGLPLALRAGQSVRRGREHLLPRHHRYSRALGREGQEIQGHRG